MPQLNPHPWFLVLIFSWLVFLTIVPRMILAHSFPNELTPQASHSPKTEHWNWSWH
uniref:ATP synthase complex subunit 8 n=1 Tax=Crenicichla regani TaxID=81338 RepID=A0A1C8DX13_9CICH|nr:ATP synthase F0 subunit 8 [Crenicichla regani]